MSSELAADVMKKKIIASILIVLFIGILAAGAYFTRTIPPPEDHIESLPYLGVKPDFTLPSVNGDNYTFYDDNGTIRIVNFMYTKCPGDEGCALVSQLIFLLYSKVLQNNLTEVVKFVSIDFDYINDTMEDLTEYANSYTQNTTQWDFLLGNENQTQTVLDDWNYFLFVNNETLSLSHGDEVEGEDPYSHGLITYFIDQNNNWRYTGLGNAWDVNKAFEAIEFLLANPPL